MNGVMIAIEGLDSSGKSTQIELLKARLENEKSKVAVFKFPSYEKTYYGKLIKRYLQGEFGKVADVNPYLIGVIYALDRLEMKDAIEAELASGVVVLLDRYVASNKAYMGAKLPAAQREDFLDFLDGLDFGKNKMPREDIILFLDVPVPITKQLMQHKKKDIHENNESYLEEVWKVYLELARGDQWRKITCVKQHTILPREQIANKVYDAIKHLL